MEKIHHAVAERNFVRRLLRKKQSAHHGNVSERKNERTENGEADGLRHRAKHFPFDADEREDWNVNDKDNDFAKCRAASDFGSRLKNFFIHFTLGQASGGLAQTQVVHRSFDNNYRTVHNQSKINCSQTHQVCAHAKQIHHTQCKQHGKRNGRGDN